MASLPCYSEKNVNQQRGKGVFEKSIRALQLLNSLGYAKQADLQLHLVYNPLGPFLPPAQTELERCHCSRNKPFFVAVNTSKNQMIFST